MKQFDLNLTMKKWSNKLVNTFIFSLLYFLVLSCGKNSSSTVIPYVNVNITIYSGTAEWGNLSNVGGWTYVNGGSKGIVVYHQGQNEYTALDRHCTYNVDDGCIVEVEGILLKDPCSKSTFSLLDGTVVTGPATVHLKAYQVSYTGNSIHISN